MVSVEIFRNKEGQINGFKTKGHAMFDDKGKDIVCAAVSILTINTVNSIEKFLPGERLEVFSDEEKGIIECSVSEPVSEKARLLLDTFAFGIENISEAYGNRFIRLKD